MPLRKTLEGIVQVLSRERARRLVDVLDGDVLDEHAATTVTEQIAASVRIAETFIVPVNVCSQAQWR